MKLLTLSAAALAVTLIACGGGGSRSGDGGTPRDPQPTGLTSSPAQAPTKAKATERPGAGSLRTTFRDTGGSERVNCSNISTEFRIIADFGWIEWTAVPVSSEPTFQAPGTQISSINVTPSSGKLEKDQSVVVKVRGTYDGANRKFWIRAQENSGVGSSMNPVAFSC